MIRIIYNGYLLDINPDQSMVLSFQGADLTQLGIRSDAYSETWELPATANNRAALGIIDDFNGSLDAAYTTVPCNVYSDNTLILIGFARVVGTDVNVIRLELTGAIGGFVDGIGALDVGELDVTFDHVWNLTSFNDNHDPADTSLDVRYCLNDTGYLSELQTSEFNRVPFENFRPWFNYRYVIEKLFEADDYAVTLPNIEALNDVFISGGIRHPDRNLIENGACILEFPDTFFNGVRINPNVIQQGFWDSTARAFVYDKPCYLTVSIDVNFNATTSSPVTDVFFRTLQTGGTTSNFFEFASEFTGSQNWPLKYTYTCYFDGSELYFQTFITSLADVAKVIGRVTITPLDLLAYDNQLTFRCLPSITGNDLLADFCNRFGLFVTINEATSQVTFKPQTNLALQAQADWSSKLASPLNSIAPNQYRSEFTYGNLARQNWYRNRNNIGDWYLTSEINGADAERDAFTSAFDLGTSGSTLRVTLTSGVYTQFTEDSNTNVKVYNSSTSFPSGWVAIFNGMLFQSLKDGAKDDPPFARIQNVSGTISGDWNLVNYVDLYKLAYDKLTVATLIQGSAVNANWGAGLDVVFDTRSASTFVNITDIWYPDYEEMNWDRLLERYYGPVQSTIARPRIDKVLIKLTPADVSNFDFSRPVTINGIRYYVNLIDQYDAVSNQPTVVELLRIS